MGVERIGMLFVDKEKMGGGGFSFGFVKFEAFVN